MGFPGKNLKSHQGIDVDFENHLILYKDMNTASGQSGGMMGKISSNGKLSVYGIHVRGVKKKKRNEAVRLTQNKINWLLQRFPFQSCNVCRPINKRDSTLKNLTLYNFV